MSAALPSPAGRAAAAVVIAAGVCAALHVAKLPPALGTLQQTMGLTLVQAGWLLSLVQVAGMTLGLVFGAVADGLGARRSMLLGLVLLAAASVAGGCADSLSALLWLRVLEGFGFLLVVLPAPGLVRRLAPPAQGSLMLGWWGTYMPLGTALALLIGPLCLGAWGWQPWWWALGAVSAVMALGLWRAVPADARPAAGAGRRAGPAVSAAWAGARATLATPDAWRLAVLFGAYAAQWLAVVGFLPTVYAQAGFAAAATGVLTALVAAVNILGNLAAGRLLQRGVAPVRLLVVGFVVMALGALAAFSGAPPAGLPAATRFGAVLLFTGVGGLIPATVFALALRVAPAPGAVSATVGWVQQWSALGQFAGPPLVAWVASRAGGWQWTGLATAAFAALGALLALRLSCAARAAPGSSAR